VILGTRDHPEEYSIWGKTDDDTKQPAYHDRILLKEVSHVERPKRSRRNAAGDDDDDDLPGSHAHEFRVKVPSKRRRTLATAAARKNVQKARQTAIGTTVSHDDENLTPSQSSAPRCGPIDEDSLATTPTTTRSPRSQHVDPNTQNSHKRDLGESFLDTRAHVNSQVDSDGLPVICSNAKLETYLKGLEAAASKDNAYVFGSMRDMINGELVRVGLPGLPDI